MHWLTLVAILVATIEFGLLIACRRAVLRMDRQVTGVLVASAAEYAGRIPMLRNSQSLDYGIYRIHETSRVVAKLDGANTTQMYAVLEGVPPNEKHFRITS